MYRSRNRNRGNNIKGPNSALTQFLQEEGISAESIRQRWLETHPEEKSDSETQDKITEETPEVEGSSNVEKDNSETEESTPNLLQSSDEDGSADERSSTVWPSAKRGVSIEQDSDEEEYDVTDSTRERSITIENDKESELKMKARTKRVLKNRKKKRRRAADLLNQRDGEVPSLQQLSLNIISKNISTWGSGKDKDQHLFSHLRDVLGGISSNNLNQLANALSKNRALNDDTLQLFLKTDLKSLTFYDCSKISYEGYKTLAIFSPHLEELSLQMCGQLNNEALLYIAEKLTKLTSLKLDGPFLINEETWDKFFEIMKGRLQEFHISNTHRFTDKNLGSLLQNCHGELLSVGFSRLDSLFNYSILPQYLTNERFHTLAIEYPYNEEDVTDEVIINILGQVGPSLKCLRLKQCDELTDSVIVNGLTAFLSGTDNVNSALEVLELEGLDQLSSDSLVYFFSQTSLPSLKRCSLMRCIEVGDDAVTELFLNSARDSLINLNLNSLKNLTATPFSVLKCDNLETIDLGFVRCIDDNVMETLCNQNIKLRLIEIFGDNLVTKDANIKRGVTVLGRQSDSI
ncbi:UV-damaged DNA-binding protein [Maudiozyma humilis]|uniref:UV-damaged DNA-binding protein n=1 Tax=Maudiozyma humilis TaxID=51915 RepID=A0AAV5RTR2_MAUHU|nr:UV-damaged DNA-binding protein [Kazachstania humilis]